MWGKKIQERFDARAWSGQIDLTKAVVTFSMLGLLGLLWLSLAMFVKFQI